MFKPVGDNILLESVVEQEESGLLLPENLQKKHLLVAEVAEGSQYKKGDEVVLEKDPNIAGLKDGKKNYIITKESQIICLVVSKKKK